MIDASVFLSNPTYWILFILFIIDGLPIIFISSILAATGVLNIWFVFILSVLGNFIGDLMYYFFGYFFSNIKLVKKIEKKSEPNKFKEKINHLISRNAFLTVFLVKAVPAFSIFGLLYLGKLKFNMKKYIIWAFVSCIIISSIVCGLAYSGTLTLKTFTSYLSSYEFYGIIIVVTILVIVLFWYYRQKISTFILKIFTKHK